MVKPCENATVRSQTPNGLHIFQGDAEVKCIDKEREALLTFKNGLIDDRGVLSSWQSDECCDWYGVECSNTTSHVITPQCDYCGLQGEVRYSLLELHHLNYLDLSGNNFGGIPIPQFIGSMKQLQHLSLEDSNFHGIIPPNVGNLTNLLTLDISDNSLSSTSLSVVVSGLESLEILDSSHNQLNGSIPDLRAFCSLTELHLSGNNFSGYIPLSIGKFSKLQVIYHDGLDLSNNQLTGKVPNCSEKFPNLHSLNLASNKFSGKESGYKTNLEFLKLIDFSSNRLTGNIPKSFSNMRGLNSLNLSRNSLSGGIIPDIGKMEMLDSLDLSHNQLYGKIPTSLADIYTLGFLDLSNNSLFGKIPTSTQLQSFNASTYAGNNGLCGDPLPECPEDSLRPSTTNPLDNMNEKENISFFCMQEVDISMVFGFIIGFWGVVGSFVVKKSWRDAFFNWLDVAGDWFYVKGGVLVSKFRPS
ncbi:receptor-like protein EIX2 [Salvia splendens]|uniref:receptor-like protein EIX2 n=1 Tax=Salvia splendens TaxID=180675 RepID=UPI001C25B857|nr:receptor-like protein EIX2 [Salvia splendens]